METEDHNEFTEKVSEALSRGVNEASLQKIAGQLSKVMDQYYDCLMDDLQAYLAENIMDKVVERSESAIESILSGDVETAKVYLGIPGPYAADGAVSYRKLIPSHPVLNGVLFENDSLKLRKSIADAHPTLIKDQRILDLEDQVNSLVKQVNQKDIEINRVRERYVENL